MNTRIYLEMIEESTKFIRKQTSIEPRAGVILGSGLSKATPDLEKRREIPYRDIPGFPKTNVAGHLGRLIFGEYRGFPVAIMQGRLHYYEGHDLSEVTFPLRVLKNLGIQSLIITAAVGSLDKKIKPGSVVVIKDHINLMGQNPLRGLIAAEFGAMFPDLSHAYDLRMVQMALSVCRKLKIRAQSGVYVAVSGPSYETPSEIRAFRKLGGDVVGMSVVPEVIAAAQMGIKTSALTWVSNMGSGIQGALLSHDEVLSLGEKVSSSIGKVLGELIAVH